eukprot:scaffold1012_cov124-Isochrysis_galbana.AAC.4
MRRGGGAPSWGQWCGYDCRCGRGCGVASGGTGERSASRRRRLSLRLVEGHQHRHGRPVGRGLNVVPAKRRRVQHVPRPEFDHPVHRAAEARVPPPLGVPGRHPGAAPPGIEVNVRQLRRVVPSVHAPRIIHLVLVRIGCAPEIADHLGADHPYQEAMAEIVVQGRKVARGAHPHPAVGQFELRHCSRRGSMRLPACFYAGRGRRR